MIPSLVSSVEKQITGPTQTQEEITRSMNQEEGAAGGAQPGLPVINAGSWAHPGLPESEFLGQGPGICIVTTPPVLSVHIMVRGAWGEEGCRLAQSSTEQRGTPGIPSCQCF